MIGVSHLIQESYKQNFDAQISHLFLYTNNESYEEEFKKTISF